MVRLIKIASDTGKCPKCGSEMLEYSNDDEDGAQCSNRSCHFEYAFSKDW